MIRVPGPPLPPGEVARRLAPHGGAAWLTLGDAGGAGGGRQVLAAAPVERVSGTPEAIEAAWQRARARWGAALVGVPVGVGFFSYDLGWRRGWGGLNLGEDARPGAALPGCAFRFYDALWVVEGTPGGTRAEIWAADPAAARALATRLRRPGPPRAPLGLGPLRPGESDHEFRAAVARAVEYLRAGDAYQVNLARRLLAPLRRDGAAGEGDLGLALFERLHGSAPAPFGVWLPLDGPEEVHAGGAPDAGFLLGNSPERFLHVGVADADGHRVVRTSPIKGTRARGHTAEADARARAALLAAAKDRAEHVMIVDLERNDLGRICEVGSVVVAEPPHVVSWPTVHHLVSTVRGTLRREVGLIGLLHATFPGGSITGAPKRRAMQLIAELEPRRRGLYTGATGWLGAAGDLDLAVAIRTAVAQHDVLELWVGAGIVVDSDPEDELRETEAKARAFAALAGT